MDDNQIIELFFARDEDAIRQTDAAYGRRLHHLAKNITGTLEDAEESVSDTYMKAWETIPPQKPAFYYAYLARICRNFSLDRLDWLGAAKRKAEIVSITEEMELCIPDPVRSIQMEEKELGRLLDSFLRAQSQENRLIFLRRFWYADSISEIADRYSLSPSAVQMRLSRTKAKLAEYLAKEGIIV